MLVQRILSSVLLIGMIALAMYAEWFFNIVVIIFVAVGLYEFFTMLELKGIQIYKYFGIGMGLLIPLSIMIRFESTKRWELLFIVLTLLFLILMQFKRRNTSGVVVDISTTLFGVLYVAWFFSFLIKIRYFPGGVGLLISVLLITKLGDIGAYLVGSRIGRIPLLPRISPKKSVEGAIAGLFFSVGGAFISKSFLGFTGWHLVLVGLSLGVIGQLGDLSESLIKRDCGIKDSGKIIPGMGGVLDEIDSLLFTAPVFYFYMSVFVK